MTPFAKSFNPSAAMGSHNDPLCQIHSGQTIFENFMAIFAMCSLEVALFTYKTYLIRSESFPYHKIYLKHFKTLLKK